MSGPRTLQSPAAWCAVVAAIAAVGLASCSSEQEQAPPAIRPVRTQVVYAAGGSRERVFSGTARAGLESELSFKVGGLIEALPATLGQQVRKGQLIARIDPADYELQVQDTEALLSQARSQARNARANYERMQALYENNNASRNDLDAALAAKESAEAQVSSVEKRLELARLQLEYTRLTAPFDGSIASVDVEVNENVSAGRPIVTLTGGDVPEVEVTLPEILISSIREGDAVSVRFDAVPGRDFPATVIEVGVAASQYATTYPVKVRLNEPSDRVRPGMAAEVRFTFRTNIENEYFVVPPVAVSEDHDGRFVYLVAGAEGDTATVERRDVVVGDLTSVGLQVTSGLADGERIVIAGVSRIHDGQSVRIVPEDTWR